VFGLSAIYILTTALLTALTPWQQLGVGESPFVSVFARLGVPAADHVMNFVVLTAALSSANANLYLISRTLFSLARAGFVPPALGAVSERGAPINALLISSLGLAAAVVARALSPGSAFMALFGVAMFGALLVWFMIFVTHIAFRRRARPLGSYAGAALIAAIAISTAWIPEMRTTLYAAVPWLAVLAIGYYASRGRARSAQ
jgi:L-asparagine transporter-like permease